MAQASELEWLMLDLINQERVSRGIDPLQMELRLNDSAEDHTEWMLNVDQFSHTGAGGSSAGDRMEDAGFVFSGSWTWGENLAWQSERGAPGLEDDVAQLHQNLMNSPGHRANILNPNFEVVGIGIELGDYRGWDAVMATQNFARTDAQLQLDGGPTQDAPIDNTAPTVLADTLVLEAGRWTSLSQIVSYSDAEGDAAQEYRLKDPSQHFDVRIDGRLQASDNIYVFDADDLDSVQLRTDTNGVHKLLSLRASDGEDRGAWDTFSAMTTPTGKRPLVAVENTYVAPSGSGERVSLSDQLTVLDGQGDEIVWYEIRDRKGADNFTDGAGNRIDTGNRLRVDADDIDDIELIGNKNAGETNLWVRAYDGKNLSDWDVFKLVTVAEDDPFLLA